MYVKSLREQQEMVRLKNKLKSNPNSFLYNIFILKWAPILKPVERTRKVY